MSKINIQGTVDGISVKTTVFSPIVEAIVNGIQAAVSHKEPLGRIDVVLKREIQTKLDQSLPSINSIEIIDTGAGFNERNRDSFDTFRSTAKKSIGGKGFGRFLFLKYFNNVKIESVYKNENDGEYYLRTFDFGRDLEIIVNEKISLSKSNDTYSKISLIDLKDGYSFEKNIDTCAKKILERIIPYMIDDNFVCPDIYINEEDESALINLKRYLSEENSIVEVKKDTFLLKCSQTSDKESFVTKVYKFYSPGSQRSKICLAAHNRVVDEISIHKIIPEFEDDFYEELKNETTKNYIVKSFVFGKYLDNNVSLERDKFLFEKERDTIHYPFSQKEIVEGAANVTKKCFNEDVKQRFEKKEQKIKEYVNENAPWHKYYLKDLELSGISCNASEEMIDLELHKLKFREEVKARDEINRILSSDKESNADQISEAIAKITEVGKTDLAHYVFNRKAIINSLKHLLKRKGDGKAELEKEIHNLIFPMGKDSEEIPYEKHNLWLLDERLVFSEYIASDKKISTRKDALGEPDLVVFDKVKTFRNGDNEFCNPLTIFEFKRPKRTSYSDKDDPIAQIGDYAQKIREGKYETPEGLEKIKANDNTPVYGYVICDMCDKIHYFCDKRNQLTKSPDEEGYFGYHRGYNMYIEVISYQKLRRGAELRNKVFFNKLMI